MLSYLAMAIEVQNENTFRAALSDALNVFLGAGFSVLAKNSAGKSMPVGDILKTELTKEFELDDLSALSLAQVCAIIESTQSERLRKFLADRFTVKSFDTRYRVLERVAIKTIFTTNVDDLVHKIYADSDRYYVRDVMLRGPAF